MTLSVRAADAGFTLVEVLIAAGLVLAVTAVACGLALEAHAVWRGEGARADLQQRARVAADVVGRVLLDAGAGPRAGPGRGPLVRVVPPVMPYRAGRRGADPPGTFRPGAFTVLRAVSEAEPAVLLGPAPPGTTVVDVAPAPVCMLPACGFTTDSTALVFDGAGNYDVFTVLAVTGTTLTLRHQGAGSATAYPAGTPIVQAEALTLYLDQAARTLRRYDGDASDLPVADDVVGMAVDYYGAPQPPLRPRPDDGTANCLYDADGTYRGLPVLVPAGASLAPLPASVLTDGPWCGAGANAFDADLLRVRRVRVALRLQAADPAVRGLDPWRFRVPGYARASPSLVPDVGLWVDVTPRNLRVGW